MVGFYRSEPIPDSITLQEMGSDVIPAGSGEVFGAAFGQGLASNLTPRMIRSQGRLAAETGLLGVDEFGRPIMGEAEPLIDPETANADYGIKGALSFDKPVPQSVAKDLYEHKHAELVRQDTIARREGGLLTGGAARFSANMMAGVLDPINIATGLIPVVGEARVASLLGRGAIETLGAAERAGVRAISGGVSGAAGMAALQPLEFGLSRQEHEDYTASDALRSIAIGGLLGGGIHVVGGAVADRVAGRYANPLTQRLEEAGPEARETLLQGAVAQHLEDRPVNVAPALDVFDAVRAETELTRWADRQRRLDAETDAALEQITTREARAARSRAQQQQTEARLVDLRRQADDLQSEIAQRTEEARASVDPVTQERLAQIDQELSAPIPAERRLALEAEQRMLAEGSRTTPAEDVLARERSQAQATGAAAELGRVERRAAAAEARQARAREAAAMQERAANRGFAAQSRRIEAQQAMLRDLTARSVQRLAGRAGAQLSADEVAAFTHRILRAPPENARAETQAVLNDIASRRGQAPSARLADQPVSEAPVIDALRQQQTEAVQRLAASAREAPGVSDATLASREAMQDTLDSLPDVERQIAEIQSRIAPEPQASTEAGSAPAAAREAAPAAEPAPPVAPEHRAAIAAADAEVELAQARAAAYERAANCIIRGG